MLATPRHGGRHVRGAARLAWPGIAVRTACLISNVESATAWNRQGITGEQWSRGGRYRSRTLHSSRRNRGGIGRGRATVARDHEHTGSSGRLAEWSCLDSRRECRDTRHPSRRANPLKHAPLIVQRSTHQCEVGPRCRLGASPNRFTMANGDSADQFAADGIRDREDDDDRPY